MLEKIIYLLTALLGFMTLFLIGFRFKTNRHTNLYFTVILFLSSCRFLAHGLIDGIALLHYKKQIDGIFFLTIWPLIYLYFKDLINNQTALKRKNLLHFIVPFVIFVLYCTEEYITEDAFVIGFKIAFIVVIVLNIVYAIASYKLLKEKVWKRNSDILLINQQNNIIKQWTQLLFSLFTVMLVRFLINLAVNNPDRWYVNQNNFLWVGALIWMSLYVKILYSPEFLYGYDVFQNKIKEYKKHSIIFDNIWIFDTYKEVINIQDKILKDKIDSVIEGYVSDIEHVALKTNCFFDENFKTADLANKLNIPKSHVLYVFKYHAVISFSDFKKIVRIQKTILLIEQGYLKSNTLESLASKTGFSSYSAFFKSFKSITGMSPQEYNRS